MKDTHRPAGNYYNEQLHSRNMGEKERLSSSCAVERGTSKEAKVARKKEADGMLPAAMGLLLRFMSGFVTL